LNTLKGGSSGGYSKTSRDGVNVTWSGRAFDVRCSGDRILDTVCLVYVVRTCQKTGRLELCQRHPCLQPDNHHHHYQLVLLLQLLQLMALTTETAAVSVELISVQLPSHSLTTASKTLTHLPYLWWWWWLGSGLL